MANAVINWVVNTLVTIGVSAETAVAVGNVLTTIAASKTFATIATLAVSSAVMKSRMPDLSDNADLKRDINIRSAIEGRKILYGETQVGGVVVYTNVGGTDNSTLTVVIAHAGHQVNDMTDFYLDGTLIADADIGSGAGADSGLQQVSGGAYYSATSGQGYVSIDRRTGSPTQATNSLLNSQFPSDFDTADRGREIAYSLVQLRLEEISEKMFESGAPSAYKCLIQGKLLYDPAADAGVAGADMIANGFSSGTYKSYSTNPVLAAIDYMMDDRLGMAIDPSKIDWDEVVDEAAYCDQPVVNSTTGQRETRFTCNGVLSTYDTHKTNLQRLLSSCNGSIAYKNGKWFVKVGRYGQGANLVSNGDFSGGLTGWTTFGTATTNTVTSERLELVVAAGNKAGRYQTLSGLTVGNLYTVSVLFENMSIGASSTAECTVSTGTADSGTNLGGANIGVGGQDGNYEFDFIATGTTAYLNLFINAANNSSGFFDNVETYLVAEKTVTADWLRDTVGIQTGLTKAERYNGARAFYFSKDETYKQVQTLEVTSTVNLSRDNQEVLFREINLPCTDTEDESQRILYKLLKMNEQNVRLTVPCNYLALDVAVHDRVMVTIDELSYSNKPFLVEGWQLVDNQGGVDLILIEDDNDYWRDPDQNDYATRTATGALVPATPEVPPPTNVTLTAKTDLPSFLITWDDPEPSSMFDFAQVYRSTTNSFGSATVLVDTRANAFVDTTVTAGTTYYYWVRSRKWNEFSTEVATTPTNSAAATISATSIEWAAVLDGAGTRPDDNATVGGQLGTNILDEGGATLSDIDAVNDYAQSGGFVAANPNAYMDIVKSDGTPQGYWIGDQSGSAARTDLLGYTDANRDVMEVTNSGGSIPVICTTAIRADYFNRLKVWARMKCDSSTSVYIRMRQFDTSDLGADKLAVGTASPTNADSEVVTADRSYGNVTPSETAYSLTSGYSEITVDFGSVYKDDDDLNTGAVDEPRWISVSFEATSAVDVQVDSFIVYWEPLTIIQNSGAPTLLNASMKGLQYSDISTDDLYVCDGTAWNKINTAHPSGTDISFVGNQAIVDTVNAFDIFALDGSYNVKVDSSANTTIDATNFLGLTAGILIEVTQNLDMNSNNIVGGGTITATTFSGSLSGNATTATTAGTVTTAAQPAITSVGTLTSLTTSGLVTAQTSGASGGALVASNTNGSFSGLLNQVKATRAASSAYQLLRCDASGGADAKFRVKGDGNVTCDGSFTGGGADFAEFMEWADGNPTGEDRAGMVVQIAEGSGGMIEVCTDPAKAIGVISVNPTATGGSDWAGWQGKYATDAFGRRLVDENGDNYYADDYDPDREHKSREDRPEWDKVGLVGIVPILDNQQTAPSWIKLNNIGNGISRWLIK